MCVLKRLLFKFSHVKCITKMGRSPVFEDNLKQFVILRGIKDPHIVSKG